MAKENNTHDIRNIVGGNIKRLRNAKKLTQAYLAEHLHYVEASSISNLENGHLDIGIRKLEEISKYFGVPISDLFKNTPQKSDDTDTDIKEDQNTKEYEFILKLIVLINEEINIHIPESCQEDFRNKICNMLKSVDK